MKTVTLAAKFLASAAMAGRWYRPTTAKLGNASAQDEGGHTPLHEAARNGGTEAVSRGEPAGVETSRSTGITLGLSDTLIWSSGKLENEFALERRPSCSTALTGCISTRPPCPVAAREPFPYPSSLRALVVA